MINLSPTTPAQSSPNDLAGQIARWAASQGHEFSAEAARAQIQRRQRELHADWQARGVENPAGEPPEPQNAPPEAPRRPGRGIQPTPAERRQRERWDRRQRNARRKAKVWTKAAASVFRALQITRQDTRSGLDLLPASWRVPLLAEIGPCDDLDSEPVNAIVQLAVALCQLAQAVRRHARAGGVIREFGLGSIAALVRHRRGRWAGRGYSRSWLVNAIHHMDGPIDPRTTQVTRGGDHHGILGDVWNRGMLHRFVLRGLLVRWWQPREGRWGLAPKGLPASCSGPSGYAYAQLLVAPPSELWRAARAALRHEPELRGELPAVLATGPPLHLEEDELPY